MKILQIDRHGNVVAEWSTPIEAANSGGYDASHIGKCLKGKRESHKGYKWKWSEEKETPGVESGVESKTKDYRGDVAIFEAKTRRSLTSLDEALDFFEVDTDEWEVDRFIANSWDVTNRFGITFTNYQIKLFLKKKEVTFDEVLVDVNKILEKHTPRKINVNTKASGRIVTAETADFHIGADIKDLVRTPDFDIAILADYLKEVTSIINSYEASEVVVNMHGDFYESISGLNHPDAWKSLGSKMYGSNVMIYADKLLSEVFLSRIVNLKEVNMISGNHDRLTPSKQVDATGEGAALLAYMMQKSFPKLRINHNPLILVREIDGIIHIKTHGHHGISKRHASKVIADYGNTSKFNLWTEGHFHSLESTKTLKKSIAKYEDVDVITLSELKYRKVRLAPLFTGNFYQESLGFGGNAGCTITFNNGKGIPIIHDYTI